MASEQSLFQDLVVLLDKTIEDLIPEEVQPDSDLKDDLGIDSLARLEVVAAIEERWGIKIPDEDADELHTVRQTVRYIDQAASTST
ncbi:acyl carrier protein [Streptomyces longispororuber]|uniref:Acyl carrier protein n=1 Tax=Streptomyces longispororuber TaxID=68230 RepID=A0A918ZBU8_9ACTN|nr:phosphopantetheine-binding protein [Streptomyces longispororuber]GHE43697.1 acyl carrier protein [Streptomyces longispororuber]